MSYEIPLPFNISIVLLLESANKSKISQVCSEMRPSCKEAVPLISYFCQGCQNPPPSPKSISPNCEKVFSLIFLHTHSMKSDKNHIPKFKITTKSQRREQKSHITEKLLKNDSKKLLKITKVTKKSQKK